MPISNDKRGCNEEEVSVYFKSMLIWLVITPLAILNGALREIIFIPALGEQLAYPVSGLLLCLFIFIVSYILIPKLGKGTGGTYIKIGIIWILATIIFETVYGLLAGWTLDELLNAYNITTGNLWLLIVIFIGFTPWFIAKIRRLI